VGFFNLIPEPGWNEEEAVAKITVMLDDGSTLLIGDDTATLTRTDTVNFSASERLDSIEIFFNEKICGFRWVTTKQRTPIRV